MSSENKQLATNFMRLLSEGQVDLAGECLANDIKWKILATTRSPVNTKEQVLAAVKAMINASADGVFKIWPIEMVAENDRVAIQAESLLNLKNGRKYNNKYHLLWIIKDKKVVEVREYHDTAHVIDVLSDVLAGITMPKKGVAAGT